jgi:hypothetical protein
LHDPTAGALPAKPGPTCSTGYSQKTPLDGSSNAYKALPIM